MEAMFHNAIAPRVCAGASSLLFFSGGRPPPRQHHPRLNTTHLFIQRLATYGRNRRAMTKNHASSGKPPTASHLLASLSFARPREPHILEPSRRLTPTQRTSTERHADQDNLGGGMAGR
ncbi:uncharacterized protein BDZ99DRAFT_478709 [Mytilinidion resinicola]|uniref:Uncharacterized protein n=1 Tax=Mytilinidion resinicola TaxID=574789 RepID=A0A6A6YH22_9PEZI|nr:uncharacterized protein BDZ99DRAFT_478709 [Mytilinidion resinicola]KAF2807197.1 hypothetical protein BDZ99DRAFT_478709 [Mytilinidion resinicola]